MRKRLGILAALVCALALAGCGPKAKTFEISGAEVLTIVSGTTGETVTITDEEEIRYVTDQINALTFSRGGKAEGDGWSESLCWYDGTGSVVEQLALMGDGYTVIHEGRFYQGMEADHEIDLAFLEARFTD